MAATRATSRPKIGALALWILPLAFLAVFLFWPLGTVFRLAAQAAAEQGLRADVLARIWRPFWFTIYQALLSTLLTLLVGLPAAYVFGRYRFAGRRFLRILTTLPFILPTVVAAAGFNALIGPRGFANLALMRLFGLDSPPINLLNTLGAILLAHVFYNLTIIIRVVGGAWEGLDPRVEQAARMLGASPWRAFWEVTLPLLRPALLSAVALVFMFDFTSFGVVLMLGGPRFATLEVEIYIQALHLLNLPLAGLLSAVQLVFSLLLAVWYSGLTNRRALGLAPRVRGEGLRRVSTWRERLLVGGVALFLIALLVLPMAALALRSVTRVEAPRSAAPAREPARLVQTTFTLQYYRELFVNRRQSLFYVPPIAAAGNSLVYAGLTVALSLALGFGAAYALARPAGWNRVLEPLLMLPLGASAVTLGLGFIVSFNRPPFTGSGFPWLIPVAHSLVALPFVVRTLQPALAAIPTSLRQAATVLGASPWQVWREIDLPIVARAALVSAIFGFTISLGEFGATTFLARPEYPTLPVAIFRFLSQPGALNYGQAMAMSTILLIVCAASIAIIERFRGASAGDF